jgi:hypothetical protein
MRVMVTRTTKEGPLIADYLATLRSESTRAALEMLRALSQHFAALRDDEPVDASEGLTVGEVERICDALARAELIIVRMQSRLRPPYPSDPRD